jgi:hypothetical protein
VHDARVAIAVLTFANGGCKGSSRVAPPSQHKPTQTQAYLEPPDPVPKLDSVCCYQSKAEASILSRGNQNTHVHALQLHGPHAAARMRITMSSDWHPCDYIPTYIN